MLDVFYPALEAAINQALKLDPETQKRLILIEGKVIKVTLIDWSLDFYLFLQRQRVQLKAHYSGKVDTTIRGTLPGLFKVACSGASGASLFEQGVQVNGDIELGEQVRDILKHIDLDWEDKLSQFIGDPLTHAISWRAKKAIELFKQTGHHLVNQCREYWQYEKNYLPKAEHVEAFYQEIAQLRDDVDRAAARLARLESKIH